MTIVFFNLNVLTRPEKDTSSRHLDWTRLKRTRSYWWMMAGSSSRGIWPHTASSSRLRYSAWTARGINIRTSK